MQRCMYVLFSRQNTKIGCFIRVFLRNSRYSHVALSLDEKLYTVYSFSRKRHDSPFSGGFMREYPVHYIINAMDVPIKLCRVDMTEEEYAAARARLNDSIEPYIQSFRCRSFAVRQKIQAEGRIHLRKLHVLRYRYGRRFGHRRP